jgi:hypothetical protein
VKIIFYSSIGREPETGIEEILRTLVPEEGVEVYRSLEELTRRLYRLYDNNVIILLRARDRGELSRIVSLSDLLQGLRVILFIPDREEETISLAHRLRPRFLSNGESDFSDTVGVLRKMIG